MPEREEPTAQVLEHFDQNEEPQSPTKPVTPRDEVRAGRIRCNMQRD
jgi:hypothetical protein